MSLESWKEEFYPVEASKCSREEALNHSLLKWSGLKKENLDKHGLTFLMGDILYGDLRTGQLFQIDASTCALCYHHRCENEDEELCATCPLSIARGGASCDRFLPDEHRTPFGRWCGKADPIPMLEVMAAAKEGMG